MAIKKISADEAKKIKGKTDWEKVDDLSDEEIKEAVENDPDTVLPTDEELKKFKRVNPKKEEK